MRDKKIGVNEYEIDVNSSHIRRRHFVDGVLRHRLYSAPSDATCDSDIGQCLFFSLTKIKCKKLHNGYVEIPPFYHSIIVYVLWSSG